MAVCKVIANGQTLIDLESDNVAAPLLASGVTAHNALGNIITGTATFGGGITEPVTAGDTPILYCYGTGQVTSGTAVNTGLYLNIPWSGTYRIKFMMLGTTTQTAQLMVNGALKNSFSRASTTRCQVASADVTLSAGDTVKVVSSTGWCACLVACIDIDNGF